MRGVPVVEPEYLARAAPMPQSAIEDLGFADTANPVREVERIETGPKREPRALTMAERVELIEQLQSDAKARRRDLPDLVFFMLATGVEGKFRGKPWPKKKVSSRDRV